MSLPSIVFDIVAIAILVGCVVFYAKKGFLSGIVGFVGTIAAVVVAYIASSRLAPWVFTQYFRPGIEEKAVAAINSQGTVDVSEVLGRIAAFIPERSLQELAESFVQSAEFSAEAIAKTLVEGVVQPLILPFLSIVLFLLVFALLRLVVGLVSRILTGARHIPVLGVANKALGALTGVLLGALYVFVLFVALNMMVRVWSDSSINAEIFSRSIVWRFLSVMDLNMIQR